MKNIFKFFGIAVLACGMMVACGDKENEENNNNNPQPQPQPEIVDGINVEFDGTKWTAASNSTKYYADYHAIDFYGAQTEGSMPIFDNCVYADEVGTSHDLCETEGNYQGSFGQTATHGWVEYYKETYLQDNSGNYYGDWWAVEATTEIKAIDLTAMTVTAKMEGTMFSAYEAFTTNGGAVGFDAASRAPYKATFGNITMTVQ